MKAPRALILAAGKGERLRPLTVKTHKSLIPIAGVPLLSIALANLRECGISHVVIVTGYRSSSVRRFVCRQFTDLKIEFFLNKYYASTNTLFSLCIARNALLRSSFILLDGDLVFEKEIVRSICRRQTGNVLVCDSAVRIDSESVEARGTGNTVKEIGKALPGVGPSLGESIGMARIDASLSRELFDTGSLLLRNVHRNLYYEAAFQHLIQRGQRFTAVDVKGAKWNEIDTISDLRRARASFKGFANSGRRPNI